MFVRFQLPYLDDRTAEVSRKKFEMTKSAVMVLAALALVVSAPALARSHHKHQSRAPDHSGPVYDAFKAPYELPAGVGPNDVPFAPF